MVAVPRRCAFGYSLVVTVLPGTLPEDVREVYYEQSA